jgi:hypothetical protein
MATDVMARAPRLPIVQPRPRFDPGAFTDKNIGIRLSLWKGLPRVDPSTLFPLAGVESLTEKQARDLLARLGTPWQQVNELTGPEAITIGNIIVPPEARTAPPPGAPRSTIQAPVTTSPVVRTTPNQTGGAILKLERIATEEIEALLPTQVVPIEHTRTGRSILNILNYDPAVGDPNPITLVGTPIPFPCIVTNLAATIAGWFGAANWPQVSAELVPGGRIWQGITRDALAALYPASLATDTGAGTNPLISVPMHLLIPTPGAILRVTDYVPAGAPVPFSIVLTCDEVDIPMIQESFLKARAEAHAGAIARQGTVHIQRNKPVILTVG